MWKISNQPAFCTSRSEDHPEAGFSLVELSVVLVVVGVLMGLSMPILQAQTQRTMLKTTREHERIIHGALKTYQETHRNNTLPCPADPKATGRQRGLANCAIGSQEGIVPYKTLGLPKRVAQDGYRHYFTYAVEHNATRPMDDFSSIKGGHIRVCNEEEHLVLDPKVEGNFVTFVLVSHGLSGEGAYTSSGKRIPIGVDKTAAKKINSNGRPQYQEGGEDHVYWVSQLAFRSSSDHL